MCHNFCFRFYKKKLHVADQLSFPYFELENSSNSTKYQGVKEFHMLARIGSL